MRTSENPGPLFEALAKAQGAFTVAEHSHTAKVQPKDASKAGYTFTFATLADIIAAVRPALSANGLSVVQWPTTFDKGVTVTTRLSLGSEWIESDYFVGLDRWAKEDVAGATTFAARTGLKLFLGVATDDASDGDAGTEGRREQGNGRRNWGPPPGDPAPVDRTREYAQLDQLCCQIADRGTEAMKAVNTILSDVTGGPAKPASVPVARLKEAFGRLRELERVSRPTTSPSQTEPATQAAPAAASAGETR